MPVPSPLHLSGRCSRVPLRPTPVRRAGELEPDHGSCKAVKALGAGPYHEGRDAEYAWFRDNDGDGTVCEQDRAPASPTRAVPPDPGAEAPAVTRDPGTGNGADLAASTCAVLHHRCS